MSEPTQIVTEDSQRDLLRDRFLKYLNTGSHLILNSYSDRDIWLSIGEPLVDSFQSSLSHLVRQVEKLDLNLTLRGVSVDTSGKWVILKSNYVVLLPKRGRFDNETHFLKAQLLLYQNRPRCPLAIIPKRADWTNCSTIMGCWNRTP